MSETIIIRFHAHMEANYFHSASILPSPSPFSLSVGFYLFICFELGHQQAIFRKRRVKFKRKEVKELQWGTNDSCNKSASNSEVTKHLGPL